MVVLPANVARDRRLLRFRQPVRTAGKHECRHGVYGQPDGTAGHVATGQRDRGAS